MADVARQTQNEELYSACERIWDNIEQKKMYITGGIGSTVDGEAFSYIMIYLTIWHIAKPALQSDLFSSQKECLK